MSTLLFSGPSTGAALVASTPFTVQQPPGVTIPFPNTVTPSDGGMGGAFTPPVATMPVGQGASCTFTYTPAGDGVFSISLTNGFGATNPAPLTYTATATLLFSGPSSGSLGVASAAFTVQQPPGVSVVVPGLVTPSDNGALGTFTPYPVTMPVGAGASCSFTFTPLVQGPLSISLTTNFGGTIAVSLAYQVGVTASFGTNPSLSKNPGSSDTVPVYYPTQRTVQRLFNQGPRYIPYYATTVLQTPTYAPMDIRGSSTGYRDQAARYGLVAMKITYCRVGARYAPAYVTVDIDGVLYKIQPFQVVTVPRIVFDELNKSSDFGAVLVP